MRTAACVPGHVSRGEQLGKGPPPSPPQAAGLLLLGVLSHRELRACLDARRERLGLDPVLVPEEVAVAGERKDDPVGDLKAGLLPERVDLVDEVEHAPLELELGIDRRIDPDREALRVRPARLLLALDDELVRLELVARRAYASTLERLEVACLEGLLDVAQRPAELRAEQPQVRLVVEAHGGLIEDLDLLHAELLLQLLHVLAGVARAVDGEAAERLAQPQARFRPRLPPELDDLSELGDLREQPLVRKRWILLRPAGEEDALGGRRAWLGDERAPQVLGQKRHHGADDAQRLGERVPERAERSLVIGVEPPP